MTRYEDIIRLNREAIVNAEAALRHADAPQVIENLRCSQVRIESALSTPRDITPGVEPRNADERQVLDALARVLICVAVALGLAAAVLIVWMIWMGVT